MGEVREGFLCPLCFLDTGSMNKLRSHFDENHSDKPLLKKMIQDMFGITVKMANKDDSAQKTVPRKEMAFSLDVYNTFQDDGITSSHTDVFKKIRNDHLEGFAAETNKLIIRLDKLLLDVPSDPARRKLHEQTVVPWIDGDDVSRCPECAKSFYLARRKHHCRLCGSVMCNDCSRFLSISEAEKILSRDLKENKCSENNGCENSLRTCQYCLNALECRELMKASRNSNPPIMELYGKLRAMYKEVNEDIEMYQKMCSSLNEGKSKYQLSDAKNLWDKIMKYSEKLSVMSAKISGLNMNNTTNPPTNRELQLQSAISSSINGYIRTRILALPTLPSEERYTFLQEERRRKVNEEILRQKQEELTDLFLNSQVKTEFPHGTAIADKHVQQPMVDEGWIPDSNVIKVPVDDPIIVQINNIKSYIKQARNAYKYDEVASLEKHLKELQEEYYRQQS